MPDGIAVMLVLLAMVWFVWSLVGVAFGSRIPGVKNRKVALAHAGGAVFVFFTSIMTFASSATTPATPANLTAPVVTVTAIPSPVETPTPSPTPTPEPTPAPKVQAVAKATPAPTKKATAPKKTTNFKNCTEVWDAGKGPIYKGDPGFAKKFDKDNDGIGCESRP